MKDALLPKAHHVEDTSAHRRFLQGLFSVILTFFLMALLSVNPPSARCQVEQTPTAPPLIVLNRTVGNLFVLSSDFPFTVEKAEPEADWLEVESVEGDSTAHRTIAIEGQPEALADGDYYSAIRVRFFTAELADDILIPVVLRVGDHITDDWMTDAALAEHTPDQHVRLQADDPNIDIRFLMTPGRHYVIEIVDKNSEQEKLCQRAQSGRAKPDGLVQTWQPATGKCAIVFPWVCPGCCGDAAEDHMADVEANLDAVNMVSYERYGLIGGKLEILDTGDPGPWASQTGLGTWPMVSGGYSPTGADIEAMWDQREDIAGSLIEEAEVNGYQGYCLDVEGPAYTTEMMRTFMAFVDYLAGELHAHGYRLMVAHATWSTIAPMEELAVTSVDYVVTMDPFTSRWCEYIPADYAGIEPDRLTWAFSWESTPEETQEQMWEWMEAEGYNAGVAGAAAWRAPLMLPHPGNDVDYYQGFRDYYPLQFASYAIDSGSHWLGEYFGNMDLQGMPSVVRDDGAGFLNFDWGLGRPTSSALVGEDHFSVRWTRTVVFEEGTYRFKVTSDDGFRLFIDGDKEMEYWADRGAATNTVEVPLSAGNHSIKLEYYENTGHAVAGLTWEKISKFVCIAEVPEGHWKGEYYYPGGEQVRIIQMVRDDGAGFLNFDWGLGSPSSACGVGPDHFSVRWTRTVAFEEGTYRFRVTSDDGFRLFIDGDKEMEYWADRGAASNTVEVPLWAGDHTIKLEYYENVGHAVAGLTWEKISGSACIAQVPEGHWKGEYYYPGGEEIKITRMIRDDGTGFLNFNWGLGSPSSACGVGADGFFVRWTRTVAFEEGTYRFRASSDDGFRLFIDGDKEMEYWADRGAATNTVEVSLSAGKHLIILHYYENGGYALAGLDWEKIGGPEPDDDCAQFVEELTIPDGTVVQAGEAFRKGWKLKNCGNTTWNWNNGEYLAVRVDGGMSPIYFHVPVVAPGETGELWADIYAPTSPGTYRTTYQMEGPNGRFGDRFWVEIVVKPKPTNDCSKFVEDLTYPDGAPVSKGETFRKGWRLSNCGDTTWTTEDGYRAVRVSGSYGPYSFDIPTVAPGKSGKLYVDITAPSTLGTQRSTYKLEGPRGVFGSPFWVEIDVIPWGPE